MEKRIDTYDLTRRGYNLVARSWHRAHSDDTWWLEGTERFVSLLSPDSYVLDVGCGAGTKSRFLRSKGMTVLGIDFSAEMIALAKAETNDAGVNYIVRDIRELELCPPIFNGVFIQATLLHIPHIDVPRVLKTAVHPLMPGGLLYIAVKQKKADGPHEEIVGEIEDGVSYSRFFSYFTADELHDYVACAQCNAIERFEKKSGNSTWLQLIARKK